MTPPLSSWQRILYRPRTLCLDFVAKLARTDIARKSIDKVNKSGFSFSVVIPWHIRDEFPIYFGHCGVIKVSLGCRVCEIESDISSLPRIAVAEYDILAVKLKSQRIDTRDHTPVVFYDAVINDRSFITSLFDGIFKKIL